MTVLCGGGSSGPQSGVQAILSVSAVAIEAFISTVVGLPEIAPILAPIIAGAVSIDVAVYCSTDPPADPGLSAGDVLSAVEFPATPDSIASVQKVANWFLHQYWFQICQCTSTTTPTRPAASNPGNVSTNPGLPQQVAPQCWNVNIPWSIPAAAALSSPTYLDVSGTGLPGGIAVPLTIVSGSPPVVVNMIQLPNTMTNVTLGATLNENVVATTGAPFVEVHFFGVQDATHFPFSTINVLFGSNRLTPTVDPPRATLDSHIKYLVLYVQNADTGPHTGTIQLSWSCPPGVSFNQPCCAPDPILQAMLQQILSLETAIFEGLPVPLNSFAESTVHAGLSGSGTILLGNAVAVRVQYTTIPPAVGFEMGSPDYYFDAGFLAFTTVEGSYSGQRLEYASQVFTVPPLSSSLDYTIKNGIVATITELTAGP